MTSRRKLHIVLAVLAVVLSAMALLYVSVQVKTKHREMRILQASIHKEEETIRLLQAEWAYLNSPQRLEYLAKTLLQDGGGVGEPALIDAGSLPVLSVVPDKGGAIQVQPIIYVPKPRHKPYVRAGGVR